MNKIGAFISGTIVGATATYIYMNVRNKRLEAEMQTEIDKIKKDYTWKKEDSYPWGVDLENIVKTDTDEESDDDDEEEHKQVYNYASRSQKMMKHNRHRDEEKKIFRSVQNQDYLDDMVYDEEEDEDDTFDDNAASDVLDGDVYADGLDGEGPSEGNSDVPYSIRPYIFTNTNRHYDKCSLIWYAIDDVLATEEHERIIDFAIVGEDWRSHVGEFEEDVAYIRNESIAVDYEIVKEEMSYFRDAL